jgi:hypothetical protein
MIFNDIMFQDASTHNTLLVSICWHRAWGNRPTVQAPYPQYAVAGKVSDLCRNADFSATLTLDRVLIFVTIARRPDVNDIFSIPVPPWNISEKTVWCAMQFYFFVVKICWTMGWQVVHYFILLYEHEKYSRFKSYNFDVLLVDEIDSTAL